MIEIYVVGDPNLYVVKVIDIEHRVYDTKMNELIFEFKFLKQIKDQICYIFLFRKVTGEELISIGGCTG